MTEDVGRAAAEVLAPAGNGDVGRKPVDLPEVTPTRPVPVRSLLLIGIGTGAGFAALTVGVLRAGTTVPAVDSISHAWILENRGAIDVAVANALTWGGATIVVLPALFVIGSLAPTGRRRVLHRLGSGALLTGAASIGVCLGLAVNARVDRLRASSIDWAGAAGGPSYPSGHTTAATLFALYCAWALQPRLRAPWQRRASWAIAAAYALVVGWTRVWLGVHWLTDVLGGWLFGTAWFTVSAAALIVLSRRVERHSRRPQPRSG